jgi:hypothetical protein
VKHESFQHHKLRTMSMSNSLRKLLERDTKACPPAYGSWNFLESHHHEGLFQHDSQVTNKLFVIRLATKATYIYQNGQKLQERLGKAPGSCWFRAFQYSQKHCKTRSILLWVCPPKWVTFFSAFIWGSWGKESDHRGGSSSGDSRDYMSQHDPPLHTTILR